MAASNFLPMLSELLNDLRRPLCDHYNQNLGLGLFRDDLILPENNFVRGPLKAENLRPWTNLKAGDFGVSKNFCDKREFCVNLDVQEFRPEELKVLLTNCYIVVEGKHEERSNQYGIISRQFTRRYRIPEDVNRDDLTSSLSSDGVLSLHAPRTPLPEPEGREIIITFNNESSMKNIKEYDKKMEEEEF